MNSRKALNVGAIAYLCCIAAAPHAAAMDLVINLDSAIGIVVSGGRVELSDDSNSPPGEEPSKAIDGNFRTKYLNFQKLNTGIFFRAAGLNAPVPPNTIVLTTANDHFERDPASLIIYGTNAIPLNQLTEDLTQIYFRQISLPFDRFSSETFIFDNNIAFEYYLIVFPTVRDAFFANSMQIAEIDLLRTEITQFADVIRRIGVVVTADLDGKGGGDTLIFEGVGNRVAANIVNIETLEVGTIGGAAADLTLASGTQAVTRTRVFVNSTLKVDGTLTSPTVTVDTGATMKGTGTIVGTVTNQGSMAPGASPGILTISGTVANTSTSRTEIDIDGATPGTGAGFHDQIRVLGAPGTFIAAGALVPITRGITGSATNTFTPSLGQHFTIVTATGGVVGTFDSLVQPTVAGSLPANARFDVLYGANAITLVVTPGSYGGFGVTPNQRAVGSALDRLRPAAGASLASGSLFDTLYALSAPEIASALDLLSGEVHASLRGSARFGASQIRRVALGGMRTATQTATDEPFAADYSSLSTIVSNGEPWRIWGRAYGAWRSNNGTSNTASGRHDTAGLLLGFDMPVTQNVNVGLLGGYARSTFSAGVRTSSGESHDWTTGGYLTARLDRFSLRAGATYTHHDVSTRRTLAFGGFSDSLSASYDARTFQAFGEIATRFRAGAFRLEPFAGLAHVATTSDRFVEIGGAASLSGERETTATSYTTLGLRTSLDLSRYDLPVTAYGSFSWQHAFGELDPKTRMSLGGKGFTVVGVPTARDGLVLEAGIDVSLGEDFSLNLGYDARLDRHGTKHGVNARLKLAF